MLTLAHFNPSVTFPKLKGEYVDLVATENFKIQRVVTENTVYFLGLLKDVGVAGSSCQNNKESYPKVFAEDNMRSGYSTISHLMSYVVCMVHDIQQRIAYLGELIEMTRQLNDMPDYEEDRVKARLVADPKDTKLTPNAPISENETIIVASELWHVHPIMSSHSASGKYEGIGLTVTAHWGVEKVRYFISLERNNYKLGTFIDVGFEDENTVKLVNEKLEEFNAIQEFIPFAPEEENATEEEV
ncbi:hypothetical protein pEaSNUABM8_00087 [Erwinia phage pEa_SNUABM_8]|nr:hypothetical protein pEaSNUABM8_00087 [Erwinia phage pEa_SNUABM_8]QVW54839.1 hypothetical protein pEaSNUABM4_00086 [Erwinia phage pEa_SNUABM_4]